VAKWDRLNKLIIDKVQTSELKQPMKEFLLDILWEEFLNSDKSKWTYSNSYEKLLKKYASSDI
jgi:hypothetical protein